MYVSIEAATSRLNGFQKFSLLCVIRFDQSFLSLTILVPLWFTISFFKALFSGFLQFKVDLSMIKLPHNIVREPL